MLKKLVFDTHRLFIKQKKKMQKDYIYCSELLHSFNRELFVQQTENTKKISLQKDYIYCLDLLQSFNRESSIIRVSCRRGTLISASAVPHRGMYRRKLYLHTKTPHRNTGKSTNIVLPLSFIATTKCAINFSANQQSF